MQHSVVKYYLTYSTLCLFSFSTFMRFLFVVQTLGVVVPCLSSYSPRSGMSCNPSSVATTSYYKDDSDSDDSTVAQALENYVNNTAPDDPILDQISHTIYNVCANGPEAQWMMATKSTYAVPSPYNQTVQY